ncbi:hypothetical protein L8106_18746 [Lyngbya sp. PCC 8106]|nr:hypothetical protein L8106_18746 [Lyngbya sp. PCC 8106]
MRTQPEGYPIRAWNPPISGFLQNESHTGLRSIRRGDSYHFHPFFNPFVFEEGSQLIKSPGVGTPAFCFVSGFLVGSIKLSEFLTKPAGLQNRA